MMQAEIEVFATSHSEAKPRIYGAAKRSLDILVPLLALLFLAPLLLLCALAIALDSRGPILFRQERVGKHGKTFTMLKFRSMYANADEAVHRAYATAFVQGVAERQATDEGAIFKLTGDARITRVGQWLRRTSLDELPQLVNALCGDMSLVGPRPPLPYEVEQYQTVHLGRLAVKPGITGPWQVSSRGSTTFDEMVDMDLAYIRHASFALDLWILLKTVPAVLQKRGAH
jgi:lipopolysaccharide/colanic/teichoic acid biosynthesis glycosyltransferase